MIDNETRTKIGFDLVYKIMNGWTLVEVLAIIITFLLLNHFIGLIIALAVPAAWFGGRWLSWEYAKAVVRESLSITIEQDPENERWYLVED